MAGERVKTPPDSGSGGAGSGEPRAAAPTGFDLLTQEIEIEFGDDRNRVFMWGPTLVVLRGAWSRKNLHSDEMVEELATMPDIPGQRIRLNLQRRTAVVYDPLALGDNKELCDRIAAIIFKRWNVRQGPAKEDVRADLDDDDLKTWLYGMARRRDAGQCVVKAGELPKVGVIEKLPGRIRIETFNSSARACKWREDFDRYTDAILSMGRPSVA